jgi:hypothetical protein
MILSAFMKTSRQITTKGSVTVSSGEASLAGQTGPEVWGHHVIEALTIVEHKSHCKTQPANAIRDQFGHLADGRATVAVADRDDVGQTVSDDELDNRLGRFGTADLFANPRACPATAGRNALWPRRSHRLMTRLHAAPSCHKPWTKTNVDTPLEHRADVLIRANKSSERDVQTVVSIFAV